MNCAIVLHPGFLYISSYEAELQLIHYKSSYDNFSAAVEANQTDSLAIVAILIKEGQHHLFEDNHISYPEAIMELMYKATELTRSEINTPIEMEVTLDQFVSNIGYDEFVAGCRDPFKHFLTFQWSPGNVSLRGLYDKSRVSGNCPMDNHGRATLCYET